MLPLSTDADDGYGFNIHKNEEMNTLKVTV